MAAVPNLSGNMRAGYVLVGVGLAAWGLFGADAVWARVLLLVAGGALIVEGLIGFCLVCWLFGWSSKTS